MGLWLWEGDAFPKRGREVDQPAVLPTANLRRLRRHRRATNGRRLIVQYRRPYGPGSSVLCRALAFRGRRLTNSGEAAILPYAPGAKHLQPGERAERCLPTTLSPIHPVWPLANLKGQLGKLKLAILQSPCYRSSPESMPKTFIWRLKMDSPRSVK